MIAPINSTAAPVRPSNLLTLSQAAEMFGVHYQSLRNWHRAGKIKAFRTCGGHRRFCPNSIAEAMGLESPNHIGGAGKKVCVYARVSSQSQDLAGSLDKQIGRMKKTAAGREGIPVKGVVVFKDVASAFGKRDGLNKLVDSILAGEVSRVYVEYADRLSRVPALTRLLEHLCQSRGVEIVAVDRQETNPNELQAAMLELVEFTTVISNRINGRKGGRQTFVEISAETMRQAYLWKKEGLSVREIARRLKKQGVRDQRGKPIERSLLGNRLAEQWTTLERVYGGKARKSSFETFVERFVVRVAAKKVSITRMKLVQVYREFCNREGLMEVSAGTITKLAERWGWEKELYNGRKVKYLALSLTTNKG